MTDKTLIAAFTDLVERFRRLETRIEAIMLNSARVRRLEERVDAVLATVPRPEDKEPDTRPRFFDKPVDPIPAAPVLRPEDRDVPRPRDEAPDRRPAHPTPQFFGTPVVSVHPIPDPIPASQVRRRNGEPWKQQISALLQPFMRPLFDQMLTQHTTFEALVNYADRHHLFTALRYIGVLSLYTVACGLRDQDLDVKERIDLDHLRAWTIHNKEMIFRHLELRTSQDWPLPNLTWQECLHPLLRVFQREHLAHVYRGVPLGDAVRFASRHHCFVVLRAAGLLGAYTVAAIHETNVPTTPPAVDDEGDEVGAHAHTMDLADRTDIEKLRSWCAHNAELIELHLRYAAKKHLEAEGWPTGNPGGKKS